LSAAIRKAYPDARIDVVPGGRGDFTVIADGRTLWDKHDTGEFPRESDIVAMLKTA